MARRCATAWSRRSWSGASPACSCSGPARRTAVPRSSATIELRRQFIAGLTALPLALRGLLGEPINLETMGGFLSWRVGNFLPVLLGLWPVIALSGTLAGEAAKGSLDLLGSTPQSRRTIALEKVAGHVTAVALAMLILAISIWLVGIGFAKLPGDEIPFSAAARPGRPVRGDDAGLRWRGVRDRAVPRSDAGDGVRAHHAVRELSHLQLRQPLAGDRCAHAAVVLRLDRRAPADGRRLGLGVRRGACRRRRRPARGRGPRLRAA